MLELIAMPWGTTTTHGGTSQRDREDREMKRRMLASMEESRRDNKDSLNRMNDNMAEITSTIKDGFALMRELYLQPSSNFAHPQSSSAGY